MSINRAEFYPNPSSDPSGRELLEPRRQLESVPQPDLATMEGFKPIENVENRWNDFRECLGSRIIGQPAAIDAIAEAMQASLVRTPGDQRPIATLAFLGPTGVGKSETAKALASLFSDEARLIKIDCSDFSHGHEVAKLVGSPAGFRDSEKAPIFTKESVKAYGTVVLFDEVEKGSSELYNLMLQILGDGKLQRGSGENISFTNSIIILTSNLGAKGIANQLSRNRLGFGSQTDPPDLDQLDRTALKSFDDFFSPEFIGRLSRKIVFHPLSHDDMGRVLDSKLHFNEQSLADNWGVRLSISNGAREHLLRLAETESHLGARPLIQALENNIYAELGKYFSAEALPEGTHVKVYHQAELGRTANSSPPALIFTSKPDSSIHKRARQAVEAATAENPKVYGEEPE